MIRLLKKILIFIVLVIGPIYIFNRIVTKGMKRSKMIAGCLNDVYNSRAEADVLIMGSSRAVNDYSPAIFDSVLGIRSYNIGVNGWPVHLQYGMFRLYIAHNRKPAYIVQNIGWSHMGQRRDFFEYEQFIPYSKDTIVRRFTDNLEGGFTFAERYFPLFAYNNHFDLVKEGILSYMGKGGPPPKGYYKGYMPLYETWNTEFESLKKKCPWVFLFERNDTALHEFRQFLTDCKQDNIKVVFVYAPTYIGATELMTNRKEMLDLYKALGDEFNIPILDYTYDSLSYDKKYFANTQHMNSTGAEIFSRKLAAELKNIMAQHK